MFVHHFCIKVDFKWLYYYYYYSNYCAEINADYSARVYYIVYIYLKNQVEDIPSPVCKCHEYIWLCLYFYHSSRSHACRKHLLYNLLCRIWHTLAVSGLHLCNSWWIMFKLLTKQWLHCSAPKYQGCVFKCIASM